MKDQPISIPTINWATDPGLEDVPVQLTDFLEQISPPFGLKVDNPIRQQEGKEYGASRFKIENKEILFRVAKTTPTKVGQFVTLWKRDTTIGKIVPIDLNDQVDYVIIATFNENDRGVFIFSSDLLRERKIFSANGKGGKLAFRVYAPWVETKAPQARASQKWQCAHFLDLTLQANNLKLPHREKDAMMTSTLDRFKVLLNTG